MKNEYTIYVYKKLFKHNVLVFRDNHQIYNVNFYSYNCMTRFIAEMKRIYGRLTIEDNGYIRPVGEV